MPLNQADAPMMGHFSAFCPCLVARIQLHRTYVLHESSKDAVPRAANLSGARSHAHLEHGMSALWDVWWMLERAKERETGLAGGGVPSHSPFLCRSPICFLDARQLTFPDTRPLIWLRPTSCALSLGMAW